MKITVERNDWTEHQPELVVLVGDPYMDTIGAASEAVVERVTQFAQGFADKSLSQEIYFTGDWGDQKSFDCVYYHTSTHKGFTYAETLKTFLASALKNAVKTGRKKVARSRLPAGRGSISPPSPAPCPICTGSRPSLPPPAATASTPISPKPG